MSRPAPYPVVVCTLPGEREEALAGILGQWPVLGCQVEPGEAGRIRVTVYLPPGEDEAVPALVAALESLGGEASVPAGLEPGDWLAAYREHVRPFSVGRTWWIDPHPDDPSPAPPGRVRLLLQPRSAFGSGSHETTRLMLLALEDRDLAGLDVLDVGTGSGVLAIAALRRGARSVVAFDVDPEAVGVARQTFAVQEPPVSCGLFAGTIRCVAQERFGLVLANIVSGILLPLLPAIRDVLVPGGEAVLSGFLAAERATAVGEVLAAGLGVARERTLDEWLALEVRRV